MVAALVGPFQLTKGQTWPH